MRTRTLLTLTAAVAALVLPAAVPAAAADTPVLTTGAAGGTPVAVGDTLTAPPGTATESLTAHTFDSASCSSNVTGVLGVTGIQVANLPYTTTVSSEGGVAVTPPSGSTVRTTVSLRTLLGSINCVYEAPGLSGTAANDDNSIAFADQHFTKVSGSGLCFADGYFTATYAPVTDGSATVFVN
ncbi:MULTISPECIES: Tat pathway signal sequence domain protein [Streptomyces]|uniref:Tat pathway signal sequence domain protein n=1 Tax=Streptomyces TaxID=1883 RepID=UPI00240E3240|nr:MULTISPECIES: Tat pathway signal sequence domain protein [Streptomyces]WFB85190.1 Tat pathway signal sequence domain protein [Streptomyces olivaceus]WGK49187.1 Tat pathway signal sequence domain protein [Streptomyces sp. B146]